MRPGQDANAKVSLEITGLMIARPHSNPVIRLHRTLFRGVGRRNSVGAALGASLDASRFVKTGPAKFSRAPLRANFSISDDTLMDSRSPASGLSRLLRNSHLKGRVLILAGSNTGTGRRDQMFGGLPRVICRPWLAMQL